MASILGFRAESQALIRDGSERRRRLNSTATMARIVPLRAILQVGNSQASLDAISLQCKQGLSDSLTIIENLKVEEQVSIFKALS